jgi:hypothetical protein
MNPSAVVVRLSAHSTTVRAMMDPLSACVEECGGMWRNSNPHFSRCPSFEIASLQSEVIFQISHVELTQQRRTTRSRSLGTNEKAWSVFFHQEINVRECRGPVEWNLASGLIVGCIERWRGSRLKSASVSVNSAGQSPHRYTPALEVERNSVSCHDGGCRMMVRARTKYSTVSATGPDLH